MSPISHSTLSLNFLTLVYLFTFSIFLLHLLSLLPSHSLILISHSTFALNFLISFSYSTFSTYFSLQLLSSSRSTFSLHFLSHLSVPTFLLHFLIILLTHFFTLLYFPFISPLSLYFSTNFIPFYYSSVSLSLLFVTVISLIHSHFVFHHGSSLVLFLLSHCTFPLLFYPTFSPFTPASLSIFSLYFSSSLSHSISHSAVCLHFLLHFLYLYFCFTLFHCFLYPLSLCNLSPHFLTPFLTFFSVPTFSF